MRLWLIVALQLSLTVALHATRVDKSGTIAVNESWTVDTVNVTGDILVDSGVTLTIAPGTKVICQGHYRINVQGRLRAIGTVTDTILFTAANTTTGWYGIRFDSIAAANDSSKLEYCRIQYGLANGSGIEGYGGGVFVRSWSKLVIVHCRICNNSAATGGGLAIQLCSPAVLNNVICDNQSTAPTFSFGGGIFCNAANPLIMNNIICNNTSSREGGGISCESASPRIINNIMYGNQAGNTGGAIRVYQSPPDIIGNLMYGNRAAKGAGVHVAYTGVSIINNTIVNNAAGTSGGALCAEAYGSFTVRGSILWGNTAAGLGADQRPQIYTQSGMGSAVAYHSDIQNYAAGNWNISLDPLLADTLNRDFRLQDNSPCINRGPEDTAGLQLPQIDLAGLARVIGNRVDMGAYESAAQKSPLFGTLKKRYVNEGAALACTVLAAGNPAPAYSLLLFPAGMTIDPVSGIAVWTPGYDRAGECSVLVAATNILGVDTGLQVITVVNTTFPPVRVRPIDGDTVGDSSRLVWHPSTDPDIRGPVRYRVLVTNNYFTQQTDSVWDTTITVAALMTAGLAQNRVYWSADTMKWSVETIDSTGYRTMYTATRGWFFYSATAVTVMELIAQEQSLLTIRGSYPGRGVAFKLYLPSAIQQAAVSVHDLSGRSVATLWRGNLGAGRYTFTWAGENMPAGQYLARVRCGERTECVKFVLVR
jgi:hypothetical protein